MIIIIVVVVFVVSRWTAVAPCSLIAKAAERGRLVRRSRRRPRLVCILIHGQGPEGPNARARESRVVVRHWLRPRGLRRGHTRGRG